MSNTYQALQCLLDSGQRVGVLFHAHIYVSMQNCRPPSFFLTNTTALHHALWLGQIVPNSTISHRWFQTSSTRGRGIHLNHSLKGVSSVTLIVCSVEWVQPNSIGSNKNTLWYSTNRRWAASASSRGQESNPLRSSSSNNFPSLCLTVNLGLWGFWCPFPLLQLGLHQWPWHWVCCHCPGHWGFLVEALQVSHTIPYHHDCILTTLSQLHVHFCTVRPCSKEPSPAHNAWVMTLTCPPVWVLSALTCTAQEERASIVSTFQVNTTLS